MSEQDKQKNESRRMRLMGIIKKHFADDFDAVVNAIKSTTGQGVSVRSVQSWLIDSRRVSHRKTPDWALRGLEDYLSRPENQDELQRLNERAETQLREHSGAYEWSDKVRRSLSVEFATSEIEERTRSKAKWQDFLGKAAGEIVHEEFWHLKKELNSMSSGLAAVTRALHVAKSFEEFQTKANEDMRGHDLTSYFVRETRTAVEQGTDEFSNDEGLPNRLGS